MGSRYLDELADVCRSAGLIVHEVDGWQRRARGSGGYDAGRPTHVMVHHTASGPGSDPHGDVSYITSGADAAPIANLYLSRSGDVHVIAGGATNTNGSGSAPWEGGCPDDSMNTHAIGIEAANGGTGEPWPFEQQAAYLTLCAALCTAYGIDVSLVRGHAEYAPSRKIDPAGPSMWASGSASWHMDTYRADVAEATLPEPPTPTPQGDDMATAILHIEGRHAQFIAQGPLLADGSVHCLFITWLGPGPSLFVDDHSAAPDVVHQPTLAGTLARDLVLLGDPAAIDDSTGAWTDADFYRVIR